MTPFLTVDSVGKSFGERRILSCATLRATRGDIRIVFGRNGIGKSTLLKIAAGIVAADTGILRINERTILKPSPAQLARMGVFFLPDHDLLSKGAKLGDQLRFFENRFGLRKGTDAAAIAEVDHLLDRYPSALSGGELRRAELALALSRRPDCLLADEPFRGVAPRDHDALSRIFRLMATEGCAVVVTGHEASPLMALATQVTWCTSGTTYELGSPEAARKNEAFLREYLGRSFY